MGRDERNTDSRARPLPTILSRNRTRWRRRRNSASGLFDMVLLLLAFLAADKFVAVLNPLALVGLGRAETADFRGDLADPLTIGAGNGDRGRPLAGDFDVGRDRVIDVVTIAELQVQ